MRSWTRTTLICGLTAGGLLTAAAGPASGEGLGAQAFSLQGGTLITYDPASPSSPSSTSAITGVTAGDTLVGLAVRPQTADLYAVGVNTSADTLTVYHLGARTGFAAPVGAPTGWVASNGSTKVDLPTTTWSMAFNPFADRIRVESATGLNLRLNPNTGAAVDGDLGGAAGSVTATNTDGPINGPTTVSDATAYTGRRASTGVTTQYTVSSATDALYLQSPPNAGTLTSPVPLTQNGAPVDLAGIRGLDFKPDVVPPASNAAAAGKAYAAILTGSGLTKLATIELGTGVVTEIGTIGSGSNITGLAIQGEEAAGGVPAIGLSVGAGLLRFNTATPGTVSSVAFTGVPGGETLVGISRRPQTGQLYGLGINAGSDNGTLYLVDPQTGAVTPAGSTGSIAFTTDGTTVIPFDAGLEWGIDFNPVVDRLRVVSSGGLNFRVNPVGGAAVDGGGATGTQPDGPISGLTTTVGGTGYTNQFARDLATPGGVTTQYTIDGATDSVYIQNPPNNGNQTTQLPILLSGSPLNFGARAGFDISSSVSVATNAVPASGVAYAALTVGGVPSLYTVDLGTGAATLLGSIGGFSTVAALSLGEPSPKALPSTPTPTPAPTPTPTPLPTPTATPGPTPIPNPGLLPDPAPSLTKLSLTAKRFRTGARPKGASTKVKRGTTLRLTLSEPASLTFSITQLTDGRKSGTKCVKATTKNAQKAKCTRETAAGAITAAGTAGANTVSFTGKVGKKRLAVGRYRLTAVATDPAKQASAPVAATFSVVK